ncbi:MAG: hypothetical protein GX799_01135 [Crenarchaeota archaeon]|jgi:uncharacterized membrane protein|nr:hypothetical protein [Thermoproteota archaeon]
MATLAYAGYVLALIGGIIIVISGLLTIIGSPFFAFSALSALGAFVNGIIQVVIGIICIIGSKQVKHLGWAIILLILGIIAGGIGGILVIVGALLGLIAKLT